MPYRHAHYWLASLFPLIVVSFWPGYFGHLLTARLAQHAHGITATAWLALLGLQSWSAHRRRLAWHRAAGLAVFAAVPLFAAAGMFAVRDMAAEMSAGSPFEARFAPALAVDDLSSIAAFAGLVAAAIAARRRVHRHAAWMLATALLVLPPLVARLVQVLARTAALDPPSMWQSFLIAKAVTITGSLLLARGRGADGHPFVVLAAIMAVQTAAYPTFDASPRWRAILAAIGDGPPFPAALATAALAFAVLLAAWHAAPARRTAPRATLETA